MNSRKRIDLAAIVTMFLFASSATVLPITLVKISQELSFTLTEGGALGFIASMSQFFILIISGFLASRFGKIRLIRSALIILSISLFLFTKSTTYLFSSFFVLFIGIGQGVLEGLLTPLVQDLNPGDSGKKMNQLHAFWPLGVFFSVMVFGDLLSRGISWRIVFIILSLFILLINFIYPSHKSLQLPKSRSDFSHIGEILSSSNFWLFGFSLFFAGGAESAFAFWSASYIQLHYNLNPRYGAIGAALFAVGMAIGRLITSRLSQKIQLINILLFSALFAFILSIFFFQIESLLPLYSLMFFMGLFIACLWPSIQSFAASNMQVDATILMIFLSCFGTPGYSSATLLMGIIGDKFGLRISFIISPIYLLILTTLIFIISRKIKLKSINQLQ